ncbi:hypothetical protein CSKR_103449 [Clonorchis sinensis]|uniref:Uncharacterized protein n=1 Tax=Clonorchis sinensis TaxID=79923 RepID=A0A3R7C2K9_CLOSI|nr:hypothetical protein CSKR_103449 [Clonorchis sinensis]
MEVTSPTQPRTDDVTSIGDETYAIQLPSSANRPTINFQAPYRPHHQLTRLKSLSSAPPSIGHHRCSPYSFYRINEKRYIERHKQPLQWSFRCEQPMENPSTPGIAQQDPLHMRCLPILLRCPAVLKPSIGSSQPTYSVAQWLRGEITDRKVRASKPTTTTALFQVWTTWQYLKPPSIGSH